VHVARMQLHTIYALCFLHVFRDVGFLKYDSYVSILQIRFVARITGPRSWPNYRARVLAELQGQGLGRITGPRSWPNYRARVLAELQGQGLGRRIILTKHINIHTYIQTYIQICSQNYRGKVCRRSTMSSRNTHTHIRTYIHTYIHTYRFAARITGPRPAAGGQCPHETHQYINAHTFIHKYIQIRSQS
jgi:hypothetical protein